MIKKGYLLLSILLLNLICLGQSSSTFYLINNDSISSYEINHGWKFHPGDDSTWSVASFDDSSWDTVNTLLKFQNPDSTIFKGIGWFRLHIFVDSSFLEQPLYLSLSQTGASEFYVDGHLLYTFGAIENRIAKEPFNPEKLPHTFLFNGTGHHIISIRYCNDKYIAFYRKFGYSTPGFELKLVSQKGLLQQTANEHIQVLLVSIMCIILFTLGFVHFLFFLFYKKRLTNLYYSIFVWLFSSLFGGLLYITQNHNPIDELFILDSYSYTLPLFFYSMIILHYSLFKRKINWYFWFATILLIVLILTEWQQLSSISGILFISFVISTVVASFFIVIKAILKKIDGAWIIGTGSLTFLVLLSFILFLLMTSGKFYIGSENEILGFIMLISVFFALLSIPISMSVYLARDFSKTSKDLENKLIEVENLSLKTLEQEVEKQRILENQKETLEAQVRERTSEISDQKAIIERKNKDITDSIDYARTIQKAILPTPEYCNHLLPNSFVLFKPKDIVSGDFYWFSEKNNKKIIAACDCTGHGVPGAFMSMIGNNILNQIINEKEVSDVNEILNLLHKNIRKTLKQEEQTETKDGMDISIISIENTSEPTNFSLEFSGAQRPVWIIKKLKAAEPILEDRSTTIANGFYLKEIKGNKFSIGGLQLEKERIFDKHTININYGDCFYIFSDGFADQFSDVDKKLMTSRFKDLLLNIQHLQMEEQKEYLSDFIENWRGKREQIDDILVIGCKL